MQTLDEKNITVKNNTQTNFSIEDIPPRMVIPLRMIKINAKQKVEEKKTTVTVTPSQSMALIRNNNYNNKHVEKLDASVQATFTETAPIIHINGNILEDVRNKNINRK